MMCFFSGLFSIEDINDLDNLFGFLVCPLIALIFLFIILKEKMYGVESESTTHVVHMSQGSCLNLK